MKHAIVAAILCLLLPGLAAAQAPEPPAQPAQPAQATGEQTSPAEDETVTEPAPRIKLIGLTVQGGWFSGATYFELPKFGPRTEVAEGGNLVYSFDGKSFTPPTWLYAPEKKIESGTFIGGRVGFYLTRAFHIDLVGSYAMSKVATTFMFDDPNNDDPPYRVNLDEADRRLQSLLQRTGGMGQAVWTDDKFAVYKGGGALVYDGYDLRILGLVPSFGLGVGAILNHFTYIQDKTALYFDLSGGLKYVISSSLLAQVTYTATMLNFSTEEVQYGKQVTYGLGSFGLTWLFDVSHRR